MILFPFLSHAQREGNEIKGVIIDSFEIKSTICPDGKRIENINEKDTTHWYQNWKVYSIKPEESKSEGNRTVSTLETIIISPGGAFVDRDEAFLNPLNPNNQNINLNIAASLAQQGYNVILAKYDVADLVETLSIADIFNDCNLNSTVPRSVLLKQSYESFLILGDF
jgi:hypothetical protein